MPLPRDLVQQSMHLQLAMMLGDNVHQVQNEAQLIAAITAGANVYIYEPITLTANRTIAGSLTIAKGGSITTAGFTLTINSHFVAGPYQVFTAASGEVVFSNRSVERVLAEWWGAVADDATDCTAAINKAIDSTSGIVQLLVGTYRVTGIVIEATVTLQGMGWGTIVKNTSAVNHSIARTGAADVNTRAIKIADLAVQHTGGGSAVDGIHMQQVNNHLRIERVYILEAPRHGIYIEGDEESFTGNLYFRVDQVWSEGNGSDGVFINGGANSGLITGGRFGGNGRYGLNVDDTVTGFAVSFPNTLTVLGVDLPGNDYGLHEGGHTNRYFGLRFEGNDTGDILFANKSTSALFYGNSFSSTPVIANAANASSRPIMYDKEYFLRFFEDHGFLEYYDEDAGEKRRAPKRSVYNIPIDASAAGSGNINTPVAKVQDRIKIKSVTYLPSANITGANTNYMRIVLRCKEINGGADVAVAYVDFLLGTDATGFVSKEMSINNFNENRVEGDFLYIQKEEFGTGMASPNGAVQVEYGGY